MPPSAKHLQLRANLTARGLDICRRMGREQTPKQIAEDIGISERHVQRLIAMMCHSQGVTPLGLAMFGAALAEVEAKLLESSAALDVSSASAEAQL